MTASMWITTWPGGDKEHPTEQAAARHADNLVRTGRAIHATYYEMDAPCTGCGQAVPPCWICRPTHPEEPK